MTETSIHPPWWFWSIGVVLLLWGLMGIWFYWIEVTMSDATYVEIYGKELLDVRHRVPAWSISGYAIGVWGGLLGTICLLLRRRWALPFYIASLIGAILGWVWFIMDSAGRATMNNGGWIMFSLVIILCLFSIWFTRSMRSKGIIA